MNTPLSQFNIKPKSWFFLFLLIPIEHSLFAQNNRKDLMLKSSLYDLSYIDFNIDVYQFDAEQYLVSQTGNTLLQLNQSSFLNLEYNISNAWDHGISTTTMGDFSVSYSKNHYSKNYQKAGFQGVATSVKMILPTGNLKYLSGFDNWIIEPSVYFGWKFKNKKNYFASKIRTNIPFAPLPEAPLSFSYGRYEAIIGYEDYNFWLATTLDNRITFDHYHYTLLCKLELGIKLDTTNGLFASTTNRLIGKFYYQNYINFGYYKCL
ncbi:hypothetical protein KMW28_25100 [Flammeovirga yaeyamensis]|uniref:Uncharacterized protein n=1 Tax=Flammeovirga yaeyamensis TaxID=367791 RepID=A0AAX1NAC8_9BACT|nr:hypothetical protein [Flammeovirga yaeyamensis]MBB3699430.1 hypothetical protein [Flammeovirga yaeyamensis]NMF35312.1 hypothetical protein [Flammeovirga yaeyamensis]QWG04172.1 hypothetical protein KMW28_25100 [Flammeovirga yaeyamensis]